MRHDIELNPVLDTIQSNEEFITKTLQTCEDFFHLKEGDRLSINKGATINALKANLEKQKEALQKMSRLVYDEEKKLNWLELSLSENPELKETVFLYPELRNIYRDMPNFLVCCYLHVSSLNQVFNKVQRQVSKKFKEQEALITQASGIPQVGTASGSRYATGLFLSSVYPGISIKRGPASSS